MRLLTSSQEQTRTSIFIMVQSCFAIIGFAFVSPIPPTTTTPATDRISINPLLTRVPPFLTDQNRRTIITTVLAVNTNKDNEDTITISTPKQKGGRKSRRIQSQSKQRRFAQDVSPLIAFQKGNRNPPSLSKSTVKHHQKSSGRNSKKVSTVQSSSSSSSSDDRIEELEEKMMNRWGTDMSKWTADRSEYEFVYDDHSSVEEEELEGEGVVEGRKEVRSQGVLNPWQKEERRRQWEKYECKKRKKEEEEKESTTKSQPVFASDDDEFFLNRVRKNQERLRVTREKKKYVTKGEDLEKVADQTMDDIAAAINEEEGENNHDSETKAVEKGTFFFNPTPVIEKQKVDHEEQNKKEKNKPAVKVRSAKLDDKGSEMHLTLLQAKKQSNFVQDQVLLEEEEKSAETSDSDDNDSLTAFQRSVEAWQKVGVDNSQLIKNLRTMGCLEPLSVQKYSVPAISSEDQKDVMLATPTGSGKTIAFLTPLVQKILNEASIEDSTPSKGIQAIIITPGRELASQIASVTRELLQHTPLTAELAIGGTAIQRTLDRIKSKKPEILICTPGRIAELIVGGQHSKSGKVKVNNLKTMVLDECDALLEYEAHSEPTRAVVDFVQKRRRNEVQCVLCSATAGDLLKDGNGDDRTEGILKEGWSLIMPDDDDILITGASSKTSTRISKTAIHGTVHVPHQRYALQALKKVLYTEPSPEQVLLFVDNAHKVEEVCKKLLNMGIIAAPLHGGRKSDKNDRNHVNKALRDGTVGLVVCTEMAARGLDAPYLTHVINYDLPTDASHYAHRAGRVGRNGKFGVVVNLTKGEKERKVPFKFANVLGMDMWSVEPRGGKMVIVNDDDDEVI